MYKKQAPELTQELADKITKTSVEQLRTSRRYKLERMRQIGESEDLYFGVVKKQARNPFNESFPFMPGFVDGLMAKLDEMPQIEFVHADEADYNSARKYQALFNQVVSSPLPNAGWARKDRHCRKFAIFSGVGVYCFYGESYDGLFKPHFETIDYYDFHAEPGGGGDLEGHLFCGVEGIFKTKEELIEGAKEDYYDPVQVSEILSFGQNDNDRKENQDQQNQRLNRHRGLGLDAQTNNYVGQDVYKLVQWCLVYGGVRWYVLFDERSEKWVRIKPLRELFPIVPETGDALWPYVAWHTHEEGRVFWSKAPADDARPIGRSINRVLNQELYNREKKNTGQRAYDPEMYKDVEALMDMRPDGLVPYDSKGGVRKASDGIYTFQVGDLGGSIDLAIFLDGYASQKTGTQTKTQQEKPADQKVGVFFGEMKQIEERVTLYNKSFKEAWVQIGYRFIQAVDDHVTQPIAIEMMGADGIEWGEFTAADKRRNRDFKIVIKGGNEELAEAQAKSARKAEAVIKTATTNSRWKDREILKAAGYTDDEIKDAFSMLNPASQELLSEAALAVDDIAAGKRPKLNYSANLAFLQHLLDLAQEINDQNVQAQIYDYVLAHGKIAAQNEARKASSLISERKLSMFVNGGAPKPGENAPAAMGNTPMM